MDDEWENDTSGEEEAGVGLLEDDDDNDDDDMANGSGDMKEESE